MKGKWFLIPAAIVVAVIVVLILRLTGEESRSDADSTLTTTTTNSATTSTSSTTTTTAPTEDVVTPDNLSFTGKVLEVDSGMALMECYDKDRFDTVWVNYSATPSVTPQVGEEYTIEYEDLVMPSLPPRIFAVKMELVSSTPTTGTSFITEEQAIDLAAKYWHVQPGDKDPETGFLMSIHVMETPNEENPKYRLALRWLVEVDGKPANYSTLDTINVDAVTGEILPPDENGVTQ